MKAKTKLPTMTETEVTRQVIDAAAMLGIELKRRNVGGFYDRTGRYVGCNEAHDSDWYGTMPDGSGRTIEVEIKKESFNPVKVRGKERDRFLGQLEKLRRANERGAIGLWVRSGADFLVAMQRILSGWRVEIDEDGWCWTTDEPLAKGD